MLAANHIRNLCWRRSSLARWLTAAPLQITHAYSSTDRTCALNAHITAVWSKFRPRGRCAICILPISVRCRQRLPFRPSCIFLVTDRNSICLVTDTVSSRTRTLTARVPVHHWPALGAPTSARSPRMRRRRSPPARSSARSEPTAAWTLAEGAGSYPPPHTSPPTKENTSKMK